MVSIREAKEIMGENNVLGPAKVVKHFIPWFLKPIFGLTKEAPKWIRRIIQSIFGVNLWWIGEIPFSKDILEKCKDDHILVAGYPVTIFQIRKMVEAGLFAECLVSYILMTIDRKKWYGAWQGWYRRNYMVRPFGGGEEEFASEPFARNMAERSLVKRIYRFKPYKDSRCGYGLECNKEGFFKREKVEFRWYLIRRAVQSPFIPYSNIREERLEEQRSLLKDNEEVVGAPELVYMTMLYFLTTGNRLFESNCAVTNSISSRGHPVLVGYFQKKPEWSLKQDKVHGYKIIGGINSVGPCIEDYGLHVSTSIHGGPQSLQVGILPSVKS